MWIETEPGTSMMLRFLICFAPDHPDPEDPYVRAYLRAHALEPKRTWRDEHDGAPREVAQYGQCYLEAHLPALHGLRARGIVAGVVATCLRDRAELSALLPDTNEATVADLAWTHAATLQAQGAAIPSPNNPSMMLIDVDVLRTELEKERAGIV